MKTRYTLHDTFNNVLLSSHRTIAAAALAERKFQRAVKRLSGRNSYIPTRICANGVLLSERDHEAVVAARMRLDGGGL